MKRLRRKLSLPIRGLITGLLVITPLLWIGVRFDQAAHRFADLYEVNSRLWQAAGEGRAGLVTHLLAEGASPNDNDAGFTVLQMAIESGNAKTVKALLQAGADPNKFINDYSPLRWARENHKDAIVVLLKQAGAKE